MGVMPNSQLLTKYDTNGPRYTSYPTALQFAEGVDEKTYRDHLQAGNEALLPTPLSLYLHFPFCRSLCYFCGCNKVVTQKPEKMEKYLEFLFQEIDMVSNCFTDDRLVKQIHFGGGTPNLLSDSQMRECLEQIAGKFHLGYPGDLEISIEIDPRSSDAAQIRTLLDMGFNRFSIGVQDFNSDVQRAINRYQSVEQVTEIIQAAQEGGADSISVDLISGLPYQSVSSFQQTLNAVTSANVDRVAIYNFAYLPQRIAAQKMIARETLPDMATRVAIFQSALEHLQQQQYEHIGMDHFAKSSDTLALALKDGELQRNFQGYTTHASTDLVGVGVSSISQTDHLYAQNIGNLSGYYALLEQERLPVQRGVVLSQDDLIRRRVIQQIMCQQFVDFSALSREFDIDYQRYFNTEWRLLPELVDDGLLTLSDSSLAVTEQGRYFLRNIAMLFDCYSSQHHHEKIVPLSRTL